jgi:hypothetical protein
MRRLAILVALGLAACVPQSTANSVQVAIAACDAYAAALHSLAVWRTAGELSAADIARVDVIRPRMNSICQGDVPTTNTVLIEFNAALTELILIERAP